MLEMVLLQLLWLAGGIAQDNSNIYRRMTVPSVFNQQIEGQLFFNSTANAFKETISDVPGGTWASGGNLNTARGYLESMLDYKHRHLFLVEQMEQHVHLQNNIMDQVGLKLTI